jgi:MFS family permease
VFLSYYLSSDIFPGTSSLDYAFVGGLSIGGAMLIAPFGTYLSHRLSHQFVMNLGAILQTAALIATSFVKQNWQLFLAQGVAFGFGMGFCFVASVGIPSHWFKRKRSLVNGIAAGGSGLGGLIYSLGAEKMLQELGIAWTARILGILSFVVNMTCANLLRIPTHSQSAGKASKFPLSALLTLEYLLLLAWAFLSSLAYVVLLFSLPSYSVAIGLTQQQGSLAGALLSLGQAIGRPCVGLASDHWGRFTVAIAASFLAGLLSLVLWIFADSAGLTYFFSIAVGLFSGTFLAAMAPITAEIVGLRGLGTALAVLWLVVCPPMTVAEPIALLLRNSDSDPKPYIRVQIFVGFMYMGAAVCLTALWFEFRRNRKTVQW